MAALAAARAKAAAAATEAETSEGGDEQEASSPDEEHAEDVEAATGQCQRDAACVRGTARDAKHRSRAFPHHHLPTSDLKSGIHQVSIMAATEGDAA